MFICQPEGIDSCWTLWRSLSVAAEGVEPRTNHRAYDLPRLHLFVGGNTTAIERSDGKASQVQDMRESVRASGRETSFVSMPTRAADGVVAKEASPAR